MSEQKQNKNLGKQIGDTVRDALASGDLSRLKDIGPAVQDAVKDIPGIQINVGGTQPPNGQNQPGGQGRGNTAAHGSSGHQVQSGPNGQPPFPGQSAPQPGSRAPQSAWRGNSAGQPAWRGSALRPMGPSAYMGIPAVVLGVLGAVVFGVLGLVFGMLSLTQVGGFLVTAVGCGLLFGGSLGVVGTGLSKNRLAQRVRRYYALLDGKNVRTIEEIATAVGQPPAFVKKDVRKAMAKQLMPDVRMDAQETCLMRGEDAYRMYLESEKARREREADEAERKKRLADPATAGMEAFKEEGAAMVRRIREANEAIPGEEISVKLAKLEGTAQKIFAYVEKHPAKLPDTRRFMSYYLPTTLKLVEKYRQYDEMDVQLPSVVEAKEEIGKSLDTIDTAFNNLLDSLYQDDTLDVTTDIKVLNAVLEQEGLTGKRFELDTAPDTADTVAGGGEGPQEPELKF